MSFDVVELEPYVKGKRAQPTFMVFEVGAAHRSPIHRTLCHSREKADELAAQISNCDECQNQYLRGYVGPRHTPSPRCLDGGNEPHCRCAACY